MPQFDGKNVKSRKCTFCHDRLQRGLLPACVQSCPSQAILFGEREGMLNTARARVKELGGNATLYGDRSIHGHVLYVLPEKPELYEGINLNPQYPLSTALIKLFARLSLLMRS
jgi:formate dehydrogenase iron-sulfur subunit